MTERDHPRTEAEILRGEVLTLRKRIEELERAEAGRHRLEEALRNSEECFSQFMQHLPGRADIKDPQGRFLFVNEEFQRTLGIGPERLIGKTSADLWPPEIAEAIISKEKRVLQGEIIREESERPEALPDSKSRWLNYRFPIPRKGNPPLIGGISIDVTEIHRTKEALEKTAGRLRHALGAIILTLSMVSEIRDPYTAGHQRRVSDLARTIAQQMGIDPDLIDGVRLAGIIHDIGKISIPAEILTKPTQLTEIEFSLIRIHSQAAFDILKAIDFPWPIAEIIFQHHERLNGSGYPQGLRDDQICLEARILAVADVVEAMASHRPYRPGLGQDAALAEIEANRDKLYDGRVVDACLKVFSTGYLFPKTESWSMHRENKQG